MPTGKDFESKFKTLAQAEGVQVIRFHDTQYAYSGVDNPCDFVISQDKDLPSILIECKKTEKSSFPLKKFTQFNDLLALDQFRSFLVIWFTHYQEIIAYSTLDVAKLVEMGFKSINPQKVGNIKDVKPITLCTVFNRTYPKNIEVKKLWEKL